MNAKEGLAIGAQLHGVDLQSLPSTHPGGGWYLIINSIAMFVKLSPEIHASIEQESISFEKARWLCWLPPILQLKYLAFARIESDVAFKNRVKEYVAQRRKRR